MLEVAKSKTLKHGLMNLKGTTVGHLKITKRIYTSKGKRPKWLCKCVCGKEVKVSHNRLIDKNSPKTHCGCKNPRKTIAAENKKEYSAWWAAKARCHNKKHPGYPTYGAKGITMDSAWRCSFEAFFKYVGPAAKGLSLDRINPHGNYEPGNVRWADDKTQARNKKNTKMLVDPKTGKKVPAAYLAEKSGMTYQQFREQMINKGEW